jgi:O-antigen ligase
VRQLNTIRAAKKTQSGIRSLPINNAATRLENAAAAFPWLLFTVSWTLLFWLYNETDAPSHPYEAQSLSDIVQGAETGSVVARIVIVTLGLVGLSFLICYRKRLRPNKRIAGLALGYLLWSGLTLLWSTDPLLSGRRLASLALMTLFSIGCAARMNTFCLSVFIAVIPVIYILPGVAAEVYYGTFHPSTTGYRFGGTAPHPNVEAATLSLACVLLCWLCWQSRGKLRLAFVCLLTVTSAFLLLTGSRTALIAMIAAIAFSLTLIILRDYRTALPLILASLCFIISTGALVSLGSSDSSAQEGIIGKHSGEGDSSTLNGRVDLWKSLLRYAAERPWSGYSFGGFWSPQRITDVTDDQGWTIQQSHSAYLDELLALGIPGAALYVALVVFCLIRCIACFSRGFNGYGAWAAVFLFIIIHNATESININPGFTNLAFYLIVFHLAFVQPDAMANTAYAYPPDPASLSR